jgi:hypothetical protein
MFHGRNALRARIITEPCTLLGITETRIVTFTFYLSRVNKCPRLPSEIEFYMNKGVTDVMSRLVY